MAFVEFTGLVAKSALIFSCFGQEVVNTLWFERVDETEWNATELGDLNAQLQSWWETEMAQSLPNDLSLVRITSKKMDAATSLYAELFVLDVNGEQVGTVAPLNVCLTVKFTSDLSGRSYHGRNYVSAIVVTNLDGNQIDAVWATAIVNGYAALNGYLGVVNAQHIIASTMTDGNQRASGVTVPVRGYSVTDYNVDSQRRRLTGRGS